MSQITQELVMVLKDHQKVVGFLKEAAATARAITDETDAQISAVNQLERAYARLGRTMARAGGGGGPLVMAGSMAAAASGRGGGGGGSNFATARNASGAGVPVGAGQMAVAASGGGGRGGGGRRQSTPLSRITNAVLSTRFGAGGAGGIQPLVGRTLAAFGITGPAAAAIAALGMLAQSAIQASNSAARFANELTQLRGETGGTASQAGLLHLLGVSGGASRSLLDRITSDPAAMGVAARMGVTAVPGPYGTLNSADATIKIIEQLRKESGEQQQRDMRMLGMEGFANLLKISDQQLELMKKDALLSGRLYGSGALQHAAADQEASARRLADAWENYLNGSGFTGLVTDFRNWLATYLNRSAEVNSRHGALFPMPGETNPYARGAAAAATTEERQIKATQDLADATRRLNRTMELSERARRAVPDQLTGPALHTALRLHAVPRGAM